MSKLKAYACGFYFSQDFHSVALITKAKPEWQKGKINGVGGSVEDNEHFQDAMIREFKEEAGVLTYPNQWHLFLSMQGSDWIVAFFRGQAIGRGIDVFMRSEVEQVEWYEVNKLPHNVLPNLRWLIPLALDGSIETPMHLKSNT